MTDAESTIPFRDGPFFSDRGPDDGLVMVDAEPSLRVYDERGRAVGTALPVGFIPCRKGLAQLWMLQVGEVDMPGVYVCRRRSFIEIFDTAEDEPD
ncbi:hypothetical protein SAMN05444166_8087 [Singulisphaera sp. GP187]|uniref:hypothetical protein n=1 Tax=Singulisphaera sp. GP187 TaxID=1882752 RepID=UPI000929CE83|nr:hypothetical protein [Singulisphaera sp. GP187]SIO66456.1 hypothetical protein SAMN05444166_8087 [Singulisphaera sp. GP187]